uniref:JmjC domain-containing protein n=1 Tax=Oryza glumipatula TaxID=40148 RepID=A0A0D9YFM0_9ORYZ
MRAEDDDAGGGEFVGARLDAGLRAARFASPPSADEFAAAVEPRNAPAVFRGVVKDWTASSRWDPRRGGLDYLREKVGPDVDVEAMMSSTGHVLVPFSKFMNSCKSYLRCPNASSDSPKAQEILKEPASSEEGCSSSLESLTLWPPSSSPYLYPMPVYGEASNHSSVSIEEPDYSRYTRARYMKEYSERVILNCGDALFIPEGWYHQVDSDDLTIAINFWWKSRIMNEILVDKEMNKMVQENSVSCSKGTTVCQPTDEESGGPEQLKQKQVNSDSSDKKDSPLQTLEPSTLQALYELISLVHNSAEMVSQNEITEPTSQDAYCKQSNGSKKIAADDSSLLEKDPIAKIILPLKPLELHSMLLAMARTFPRTLEALVVNMLGPIGAEILTRKFDEMDQQATKEQQSEFYKTFYSVFDDQYAAMDALLNGKEMFSFQVFQSVLRQYIGVTLAGLLVLTKGQ